MGWAVGLRGSVRVARMGWARMGGGAHGAHATQGGGGARAFARARGAMNARHPTPAVPRAHGSGSICNQAKAVGQHAVRTGWRAL
jgi:hypothetical protein